MRIKCKHCGEDRIEKLDEMDIEVNYDLGVYLIDLKCLSCRHFTKLKFVLVDLK